MSKELSEMSLEELWKLFPIILKDYNPCYPTWYEAEKNNILSCINIDNVKRINHIGSTAVAGLISKPTIDILLEIDNKCDLENLKKSLLNNGWTLMSYQKKPEMWMAFNKGYTKNGFAEKVFHLHIKYYLNCDELYFRDYLIENGEICEEYSNLKIDLQKKYRNNRDMYTKMKTDFIKKKTEIARKIFNNRYDS